MGKSAATRRSTILGFAVLPVGVSAIDSALAQTVNDCVPAPAAGLLTDDDRGIVVNTILEEVAGIFGLSKAGSLRPIAEGLATFDPVARRGLQEFYDRSGPLSFTFPVKTREMLGAFCAAMERSEILELKGISFAVAAQFPLLPNPRRTPR